MPSKYFIVKSKTKYSRIYVRIWDSQLKVDLKSKLPLTVLYSSWSKRHENVKNITGVSNKDAVNKKLRDFKDTLNDAVNMAVINEETINKNWLDKRISDFFNQIEEGEEHKIYFLDYVKRFIENAPKRYVDGKKLAPSTIKRYSSTYKVLNNFEEHTKSKLKHKDITLDFYHSFLYYCDEELDYQPQTIGKLISHIKLWCKEIELEGFPVSQHYRHRDFKRPSGDTIAVYLKEDEIKEVVETDFSHSERLDNVRDLFVIGLRTGLRISDLKRINKIDLERQEIDIVTQKTNERVVIPLHPEILNILNKRDGKIPNRISDQKFNEYVKEVAKEAGLTEVRFADKRDKSNRKLRGHFPMYEFITSHTCRRSFATNLYGTGEVPNLTIMAVIGHKTERQLLEYVKTTKEEHAEKVRKLWEKKNSEE